MSYRSHTGEVKKKKNKPDQSATRMCQSANRFSSTSFMSPQVWPGCLSCAPPPPRGTSSVPNCRREVPASALTGIWRRGATISGICILITHANARPETLPNGQT